MDLGGRSGFGMGWDGLGWLGWLVGWGEGEGGVKGIVEYVGEYIRTVLYDTVHDTVLFMIMIIASFYMLCSISSPFPPVPRVDDLGEDPAQVG